MAGRVRKKFKTFLIWYMHLGLKVLRYFWHWNSANIGKTLFWDDSIVINREYQRAEVERVMQMRKTHFWISRHGIRTSVTNARNRNRTINKRHCFDEPFEPSDFLPFRLISVSRLHSNLPWNGLYWKDGKAVKPARHPAEWKCEIFVPQPRLV